MTLGPFFSLRNFRLLSGKREIMTPFLWSTCEHYGREYLATVSCRGNLIRRHPNAELLERRRDNSRNPKDNPRSLSVTGGGIPLTWQCPSHMAVSFSHGGVSVLFWRLPVLSPWLLSARLLGTGSLSSVSVWPSCGHHSSGSRNCPVRNLDELSLTLFVIHLLPVICVQRERVLWAVPCSAGTMEDTEGT